MRKRTTIPTLLFAAWGWLALPAFAGDLRVAYIRGASPPWSQITNETAMNRVFGPYGWDDLRLADGPAPFTTGSGDDYEFIFVDGSDSTANEFSAFLAAHGAAIDA